MKLAVYTYNAEPFTWYPSLRVAFVDFSRNVTSGGPVWKKADPGRDGWISPMELMPSFDAWLWVDSRVNELTIDFWELCHQISHLNPDRIYGIGKSENGFKTISTGCLTEPDSARNEKLLNFIYGTVLLPESRKYSIETPLQTFSAVLFLDSLAVESACRDAVELVNRFQGLNPQVALNWTAWKNTVQIEEIEDLSIQRVRHKIWTAAASRGMAIDANDAQMQRSSFIPPPAKRLLPHKPPAKQASKVADDVVAPPLPTADPLNGLDEPDDNEIKPAKPKDSPVLVHPRPNAPKTMARNDLDDVNAGAGISQLGGRKGGSFNNLAVPPVSVMMTTWNRTPLAVKCLKGLVKDVDYPASKLSWVLADDGSEPGHVEACIDALTSSGVSMDRIYVTRNYRSDDDDNAKFGHALNLNNGLREAFKHSDIVLRTEDDLLPSQKIPIADFVKILRDNDNVAGIKLGHGADIARKLPWKGDPRAFAEDASYWNVFIFNHLAMICHRRVYDSIGMYNEDLAGADVEKDIGKRFMDKFRNRTPEQEYDMKVLVPTFGETTSKMAANKNRWFYFTHIGKDSVSGHSYRTDWSDDVIKLNSKELAEDMRAESARM